MNETLLFESSEARQFYAALETIESITIAGNEGLIADFGSKVIRQFKKVKVFFQTSAVGLQNILTDDRQKLITNKLRSQSLHMSLVTDNTFDKILTSKVPTVVGLKGHTEDLAETLQDQLVNISKDHFDQLDILDDTVSKLLTSEDYRVSFAKKNNSREMMKVNDDMKAALKKHIDTNDHTDTKVVNEVAGNASGFKRSMLLVTKNNQLVTGRDLKNTVKYINKINDKVMSLLDLIKTKDIVLSPESAMSLKNLLGASATYITLLTSVFYLNMRLGQVLTAIYDVHKEKN
jgi:hypothetical protein